MRGRPAAQRRRFALSAAPALVLAASIAAAGWLPFVHRYPTSDEGGFLVVASQWRPGGSLYGDYWVDRPPVLIALFQVVGHLGGTTPLRVLGAIAAVLSTALAACLALVVQHEETSADASERLSSPPLQVLAPSLVAAVFLSTPLFGAPEVDGEVLAVPLVLLGFVATWRACTGAGSRSTVGWAILAGGAGTTSALIKQNVVDVVVVAAVIAVSLALLGRWREVVRLGAGLVVGSLGMLVAILAWAAHRGTSPTQLWLALGPFRAHAAAALDAYSRGRSERLHSLVAASVVSGAVLLVVVLLVHAVAGRRCDPSRERPDLLLPAVAVLVWESCAMALGGSYWHHYLTGLVPGLVLLTVAGTQRRSSLWPIVLGAVCLALLSDVVALSRSSLGPGSPDLPISSYLAAHAAPGDSVLVCFGHADIVWGSGLPSPYPYLWSLPVQVKDPRLQQLDVVLRRPASPTWVVVRGPLSSWGVDARTTQRVLRTRYRPTARFGSSTIYRHRRSARGLPSR